MTPDDAAWQRLRDAAAAPYRAAGRFAFHFARGKLGGDPVFRQVVAAGWIAPGARVLDIGCGQGLLASLLRIVDPTATVTGIELTARDVERARRALPGSTVLHGDMRVLPLPPCDIAVMLDVLHYVARPAQDALLARVAAALAPGGRLLLRVGDATARGDRIARAIDAVVARWRGYRVAARSGRGLADWTRRLRTLGFEVVAHPMSQGTPFANTLLVCTIAACCPTPTSKP